MAAEDVDHASLIGLDVHEAAARAVELGWEVRAFQPGTPLTADNTGNRIDLCYRRDGVVTDAAPS